MSKHTPTPWKVIPTKDGYHFLAIADSDGSGVTDPNFCLWRQGEEAKANADHIVHCVNTYPDLVKALEPFAAIANIILRDNPSSDDGQMIWSNGGAHREHISYSHIRAASAALAKTKVKS